ncbi:MAG: A24 family peptidase C-terminal domain-containing protein [Methanomassiliicoccales archaeon]|jgi:preflagellin peptidase FlaK
MDWLPLVRLGIALAIACSASISDWRKREVSDAHWAAMGIAGLALLAVQIFQDNADLTYLLFLLPLAWFFFDMLVERRGMFEDGINPLPIALYLGSFVIMAFLLSQFWNDGYMWQLLVIPILFVLIFFMYQFSIIKGGADAKALMAIALLIPKYPMIAPFPLIHVTVDATQYIMPFAILVMFNAALLTLVVPLVMLFYNMFKRDVKFPAMLFGYTMEIPEARKKFVWPMEYIKDGVLKMSVFVKSDDSTEEQINQLEAAGKTRIWVTPKIPFLIPITGSLLFSAIVGNIIFFLVQ